MELIQLMVGLFGGFILGSVLLVIAAYIISSLAFVKIFTKLGYETPWFGWIPILNIFVLATLVTKGVSKVKVFGLFELDVTIYRFLWLAGIALGFIDGSLGRLLSFAFAVVYYGDMYSRVYAAIDNTGVENQTVLGAISAIISIIFPIKALASDSNPMQIRYRADDVR